MEDINAIASKFFVTRGKARTLQFQPSKGTEVFLELDAEQYLEIVTQLEDLDTVDEHLVGICVIDLCGN
jgi:hypothetical protein